MPSTQLWTHRPDIFITHECPGPRTVHVAASCPSAMHRYPSAVAPGLIEACSVYSAALRRLMKTNQLYPHGMAG